MRKLFAGVFVFLFILGINGICRADTTSAVSTILDGISAKQGGIYLYTDKKAKNVTTFTILSTNHVDAWGKAGKILWDGTTIEIGPDYDAANKIDGGVVLLGKNVNGLLDMLPVTYPFKDSLNITAYLAGDNISSVDGKIRHQFCQGAAYIKFTVTK